MKIFLSVLFTSFLLTASLHGSTEKLTEKLDHMHRDFLHEKVKEVITAAVKNTGNNKEKAGLYWRLSRAVFYLGEQAEARGEIQKNLLAFYEEGEALARKTINLDPENPMGYYWKSANMGRWGQVKGILESLDKAEPIRQLLIKALRADPENPDAYDVLGQLYELVPGWPIAFGNIEYSVSLGRKAVDLQKQYRKQGTLSIFYYSFYTNLASHLWTRNWDSRKRKSFQKEILKSYNEQPPNSLEKNCYYEAVADLNDQSDRQEAAELIRYVIIKLGALSGRTQYQQNDLREAQKKVKKWGM